MSGEIIAAALALIGFVITQSILKFVIEPIREQKRLVGEVAHALEFYANASVDDTWKEFLEKAEKTERLEAARKNVAEAEKALRGLASRLRASLWSIPFYRGFAIVKAVHKPADVLEASRELVEWSNSLVGSNASQVCQQRREVIAERLGTTRKLRNFENPWYKRWLFRW